MSQYVSSVPEIKKNWQVYFNGNLDKKLTHGGDNETEPVFVSDSIRPWTQLCGCVDCGG